MSRPGFGYAGAVVAHQDALQTASFDVGVAPDEFLGPAFALLAAGAAAVSAALWNLGEVPSALFHVRLYENLISGQEPLPAHQNAVRWLRTSRTDELMVTGRHLAPNFHRGLIPDGGPNPPFAQPSHWAPFVYIGY